MKDETEGVGCEVLGVGEEGGGTPSVTAAEPSEAPLLSAAGATSSSPTPNTQHPTPSPSLRVDIVTLFPGMVTAAAGESILGRAQTTGRLDVRVHDLRNFTHDRHRTVDDAPFGGGVGMVMMCAPLFECLESVLAEAEANGEAAPPVILLAPDGETFTQEMARELAALPRYIMVCGHYEGVDERVRDALITREVSIGDYVLTGGELPALVILDATARLLPGVLGNAASAGEESFDGGVLEYPHYTRPSDFRGRRVPDILLSGHHANIEKWRRGEALSRTRARRPDLWAKLAPLSKADQKILDAHDAVAAKDE